VGFGWAKPVQVNPRSFKNVRADYLKVTIAGPVSNLVTGFAFALLTGFLSTFVRYAPNGGDLLYTLLFIIIRINCILCVFNLLPIPPLDGYQVLKTLVPAQYGRYLYYLERYQLILLFIIILIPGASSIITVPAQGLYYLMTNWITLLR
jgi:Zn-dependent protease